MCLSLGCSNNAEPTTGTLNVNLSSPNADDGAVLVAVTGGPVDSVESAGYTMYSARGRADTVKLIVTGTLPSGVIARIHIPDSRQASRYGARVLQAAARSTYSQRDPTPYGINLLP
jgi:hypothetical protein